MQNRSIEPYLNRSFACDCGRTHKSLFAHYIFEAGAIAKLPALLERLGYTRPYLICDTHTYEIAGARVEETLHKANIGYTTHVLKSPENGDLAADEQALGSVAMANDKDADIIISIGTVRLTILDVISVILPEDLLCWWRQLLPWTGL